MPGKDLSAELFGSASPVSGNDLSAELFPTESRKRSTLSKIGHGIGDFVAGGVRGAGSIGATILAPIDIASDALNGKGLSLESNRARRAAMDASLQDLGADTGSMLYKGGKLAGEIAGTAGAGGAIANGARLVAPTLAASASGARVLSAIASGGFNTGAPVASTLAGRIGDLGIRAAGGTIAGGASAALTDPENAGVGAVVGAALPGATRLGGLAGGYVANGMQNTARRWMQSAIKPTIAERASGDADLAVETMLQHGINPTRGGVTRLEDMIGGLNDRIAESLSNSTASVSKGRAMAGLNDVRRRFGDQVSPTADLHTIENTADDFLHHPNFPDDQIPVQAAQRLKQGTYSILRGKFGQVGSAETEAQKGLARGLKDEIADAVPGIADLNAQESRLIRTRDVAERRALLEMNKNPVGLAGFAHSPLKFAMMMADKSALAKSLAARAMNATSTGVRQGFPLLDNGMTNNPMLRTAATNGPSLLD